MINRIVSLLGAETLSHSLFLSAMISTLYEELGRKEDARFILNER
jgi:hypothetical protein